MGKVVKGKFGLPLVSTDFLDILKAMESYN